MNKRKNVGLALSDVELSIESAWRAPFDCGQFAVIPWDLLFVLHNPAGQAVREHVLGFIVEQAKDADDE
jgi:hypothetical protein